MYILTAEVLWNPFEDIVPREIKKPVEEVKEEVKKPAEKYLFQLCEHQLIVPT